jgi:hypothetical protein
MNTACIYCCGPDLAGHNPDPYTSWSFAVNDAIAGPYPATHWVMLDAEPFIQMRAQLCDEKWNLLKSTPILTNKGWKMKVDEKAGKQLRKGWIVHEPLLATAGSTVISLLEYLKGFIFFSRVGQVELYGCGMRGTTYHTDRTMRNPDWWIRNRWARERAAMASLMRDFKQLGIPLKRIRGDQAEARQVPA